MNTERGALLHPEEPLPSRDFSVWGSGALGLEEALGWEPGVARGPFKVLAEHLQEEGSPQCFLSE